MRTKGTYKDGEWDGPYESYHENHLLLSKGTYKDGDRCGEWFEDCIMCESGTVTYPPCPPGLEDAN